MTANQPQRLMAMLHLVELAYRPYLAAGLSIRPGVIGWLKPRLLLAGSESGGLTKISSLAAKMADSYQLASAHGGHRLISPKRNLWRKCKLTSCSSNWPLRRRKLRQRSAGSPHLPAKAGSVA